MRLICAWCNAELRPASEVSAPSVSHGICKPCLTRELGALALVPEAPPMGAGVPACQWRLERELNARYYL